MVIVNANGDAMTLPLWTIKDISRTRHTDVRRNALNPYHVRFGDGLIEPFTIEISGIILGTGPNNAFVQRDTLFDFLSARKKWIVEHNRRLLLGNITSDEVVLEDRYNKISRITLQLEALGTWESATEKVQERVSHPPGTTVSPRHRYPHSHERQSSWLYQCISHYRN